jgi:hypothetical protein
MHAPDHLILDQPWCWEIEEFVWHSEHGSAPAALDVRSQVPDIIQNRFEAILRDRL